MHMLANHVFDLSENIFRLKGDFTASRRMLDIVAANQREENETMRVMGDHVSVINEDLSATKAAVQDMKQEMDEFRRETQNGLDELKSMMATLSTVVMQMRH